MFISKLIFNDLREQISWLREQVEREKRRADLTVDRLLAKTMVAPVSPELNPIISSATVGKEAKFQKEFDKMQSEMETIGEDFEEEKPNTKVVLEA